MCIFSLDMLNLQIGQHSFRLTYFMMHDLQTLQNKTKKLNAITQEIMRFELTSVHAFVYRERINKIAFAQGTLDEFVQFAHFQ